MVCVDTPSTCCLIVQIWQQAFDQIIVAILIFQLLMIGLVGLKEAPIQAGLMAPLPFITLIYRLLTPSFRNYQDLLRVICTNRLLQHCS